MFPDPSFTAGGPFRASDGGGNVECTKCAGIKIFLDINKIACYINSRKKKRRRKVNRKKSRRRIKKERTIQDVSRKREKKKSLDDEFN
jgi:hypothetical protein